MDSRTRQALDRVKAYFGAEMAIFVDSDNRVHRPTVVEPSTADMFLVFSDSEAKRELKAELGIQETIGYG